MILRVACHAEANSVRLGISIRCQVSVRSHFLASSFSCDKLQLVRQSNYLLNSCYAKLESNLHRSVINHRITCECPLSVKEYQPPNSKSSPHYQDPPPFLKISHPSTFSANPSSQVFLINRNATVKSSSINTIYVKQQHNVGFFIFKFTLKHMLDNVYINKIYARQCLYIISSYCREGFSHSFNFFVVSKGILHV